MSDTTALVVGIGLCGFVLCALGLVLVDIREVLERIEKLLER